MYYTHTPCKHGEWHTFIHLAVYIMLMKRIKLCSTYGNVAHISTFQFVKTKFEHVSKYEKIVPIWFKQSVVLSFTPSPANTSVG